MLYTQQEMLVWCKISDISHKSSAYKNTYQVLKVNGISINIIDKAEESTVNTHLKIGIAFRSNVIKSPHCIHS